MNWKIAVLGIGVPFAVACGSGGETTPEGAIGAAAPGATTTPTATTGPAMAAAGSGAVSGAASSGTATNTPATGAAAPAAAPAGATPGAATPATTTAAMGTPGAGATMPTAMRACPTCAIPPECQGFPLEGIKYSPGGEVLPNKCEPFHATLNNPYAVRCIDAMPEFKTPFPGDEYCILPPEEGKGTQIGFHPQGTTKVYWDQIWAGDYSGYDTKDPEWVLPPGDERTQNYRSHDAMNPEATSYYRTYFRMRTGSHHMIITMHDTTEPDGWIPGVGEALPGFLDPSSGATVGILGGAQRPDDNTPFSLAKPPEDDGYYLTFPADPAVIFNVHHFNSQDKDLVREAWNNIWWEEDARTVVSWYMGLDFTQVAALSVSPGQVADFHYSWGVGGDVRLVRMFGHRHFWTTNLTSWIERGGAGGEKEIVYQSFDWFDMPTFRYDSVVMNPPVNTEQRQDGAASGIVMLKAGDKLHFNCHIEFTNERQATDKNAPSPSEVGTLRFANEAYNGEMCINFGNVTGGGLGLPGADSSPVPDFAKVTRGVE